MAVTRKSSRTMASTPATGSAPRAVPAAVKTQETSGRSTENHAKSRWPRQDAIVASAARSSRTARTSGPRGWRAGQGGGLGRGGQWHNVGDHDHDHHHRGGHHDAAQHHRRRSLSWLRVRQVVPPRGLEPRVWRDSIWPQMIRFWPVVGISLPRNLVLVRLARCRSRPCCASTAPQHPALLDILVA